MPRKNTRRKAKKKRGRPPKKKTRKRKTTKTAKRVARASRKPNVIRDAPEHSYFILCNGKPVKNIKELADILEDLEDQVFEHHVGPDKNDFAKWVEDIFKDIELAQKIADAKNKRNIQFVIYRHITHKLW